MIPYLRFTFSVKFNNAFLSYNIVLPFFRPLRTSKSNRRAAFPPPFPQFLLLFGKNSVDMARRQLFSVKSCFFYSRHSDLVGIIYYWFYVFFSESCTWFSPYFFSIFEESSRKTFTIVHTLNSVWNFLASCNLLKCSPKRLWIS